MPQLFANYICPSTGPCSACPRWNREETGLLKWLLKINSRHLSYSIRKGTHPPNSSFRSVSGLSSVIDHADRTSGRPTTLLSPHPMEGIQIQKQSKMFPCIQGGFMCLDAPDLRIKTTEKTGGPGYGPFSFVFALLCNLSSRRHTNYLILFIACTAYTEGVKIRG